ncbi:MAG: 50S ribosomal protein L21 [Leptospiraceae bacterium]|nr:50S ribosomal protein L21 [Leptospiraceae bacterium]MCP5511294.1 50S ribosomal protein L21 [Leptospiraceae bacterium]
MYAVITIGNQQFKVEEGQTFLSQRTGKEVGTEFESAIHLLAQENKVHIGTPLVSGAKAVLKVVSDVRGDKIQGFKYKKRKSYYRRWGHRQELQKLQVVSISAA